MKINLSFEKKTLKLPKRFELLEFQAKEAGAEISKIVKKIDSACEQINYLLSKIQIGGAGQFQLFCGESGSGKTTFLRTLPAFFENISTHSFSAKDTYDDVINYIENSKITSGYRVFIIDEKDNPSVNEQDLRIFFEKIRILFRTQQGRILLIWPITDKKAAETIGRIAWEVGKESISPNKGPIYYFVGLSKDYYFETADDTVRNLNSGENLDSFGITQGGVSEILDKVDTIGEFYSQIEEVAYNINEEKWKILESKIKPKVWVLLLGDTSADLELTVRALTQGIENKIDIDRMCAFLDDESNKSSYLNDWRSRRTDAGFLLRFLDVRLFSIAPNLALSAVRVFGDKTVKENLKKQSENKKICLDAIKRSEFYIALTEGLDSSKKSATSTNEETQKEYLRLQQTAKTNDKELNKAFAKALEYVFKEDSIKDITVKSEKQGLKGTNLKPDIEIDLPENKSVCLELTWRSTGQEVKDEISSKQSTLTIGHIQQYVLDKVMDYVKELGL